MVIPAILGTIMFAQAYPVAVGLIALVMGTFAVAAATAGRNPQ